MTTETQRDRGGRRPGVSRGAIVAALLLAAAPALAVPCGVAPAAGGQGRQDDRDAVADPLAELSIEPGAESHDFGAVRQGERLEHTFALASTGENPVRVREARSTCGCAIAELLMEGEDGELREYALGEPIAPGSRLLLRAKLDSMDRRNRLDVRLDVHTNEPRGHLRLALGADVEPFLEAAPALLDFGGFQAGTAATRAVDVRTTRGEPVALTVDPASLERAPTGVRLELEPVAPQDGRSPHWRLIVSIAESAPEGQLGCTVRLLTDAQVPGRALPYRIKVGVRALLLGPIHATPRSLMLGLVRPGRRASKSVELVAGVPGVDLSGIEVEVRGEGGGELLWEDCFRAVVEAAPGPERKRVITLEVDGLPADADGVFRGELLIRTGYAPAPEVVVPFMGVCRPASIPDGREDVAVGLEPPGP